MKIYIAGPITNNPNYCKQFSECEEKLRALGHAVMNPAWIIPSRDFCYQDYMKVSISMLEVCDGIFMLPSWNESNGATEELLYAIEHGYTVFYSFSDLPEKPYLTDEEVSSTYEAS